MSRKRKGPLIVTSYLDGIARWILSILRRTVEWSGAWLINSSLLSEIHVGFYLMNDRAGVLDLLLGGGH